MTGQAAPNAHALGDMRVAYDRPLMADGTLAIAQAVMNCVHSLKHGGSTFLDDEDAVPFPEGSENRKKQLEMSSGTPLVYGWARKYGLRTAFGTDVLFSPPLAERDGKVLAKLKRWYTPFEVLKMATHDNVQLFKMCGPRDPYKEGNPEIS